MHNRRHGRVRAKGIATQLRDGAQLTSGLSVENLSRGGAFVRSAVPMKPGSPVALDLVRPGLKRSLQLTGRVVSVVTAEQARETRGAPGMGIQFDPYTAAVGERLTELLLSLGAGPAVLDADPPVKVVQVVQPQPVAPPSRVGVAVPESAKLMVQVTGLLMELGDAQSMVSQLERENGQLRAEVVRLTARLESLESKARVAR